MANPRALEGDSGIPQGMGMPQDSMDIPANKNGFSSWLSKLSSKSARRGSIGFSGEADRIDRFDDDSGDGMAVDSKEIVRMDTPLGAIGIRSRNVSVCDMQTPGGDGEMEFYNQYRRRMSTDFVNTDDSTGLALHITKDGMLKVGTDMERKTSVTLMQPIVEGKELALTDFPRGPQHEDMDIDHGLEMKKFDMTGRVGDDRAKFGDLLLEQRSEQVTAGELVAKRNQEGGDGIFLIDLETVKDGQGVKLKPQSKLFSLSTLLKTQMTQNWFFRNDSAVEDDDNASDAHDALSASKRRPSNREDEKLKESDANEKNPDDSISFLGKIRKAMDDQPSRLRDINLWQPQST